VVADEDHAEEAGVDVEAIEAHGMVVIPEGGGVLLQRIVAGARIGRGEPVLGVAVVLGRTRPPCRWTTARTSGTSRAAAVQAVVDGEEVLGGELIDPLDLKRLMPLRASMRASEVAALEASA
jgi:hypothetical protein